VRRLLARLLSVMTYDWGPGPALPPVPAACRRAARAPAARGHPACRTVVLPLAIKCQPQGLERQMWYGYN